MKVQSVGTFGGYIANKNVAGNMKNNLQMRQKVAFGSTDGKIVGGALGASATTALTTIALMTGPLGWLTFAAIGVACAGGACVGGAIGDAVTGSDKK